MRSRVELFIRELDPIARAIRRRRGHQWRIGQIFAPPCNQWDPAVRRYMHEIRRLVPEIDLDRLGVNSLLGERQADAVRIGQSWFV
nr:hypothetical protein [Bradyrhizobium retamae]